LPPKGTAITPLAAYPLEHDAPILFHDHVRVPDGRTGSVIGFYRRRENDSVLVRFAPGESAEFFTPEVKLV
jgi:hypothetical protein